MLEKCLFTEERFNDEFSRALAPRLKRLVMRHFILGVSIPKDIFEPKHGGFAVSLVDLI